MSPDHVKIYKGNKLIREGTPRSVEMPNSNMPFGMGVKDVIYLIVMVGGFLLNGYGAYTQIQKNTDNIQKTTEILTQFIRQSDGYHSAVTGDQFEMGKPTYKTNFKGRSTNGGRVEDYDPN